VGISFFQAGVLGFSRNISLPGVGVIHTKRGWVFDDPTLYVNKKTLEKGTTLILMKDDESISINTSQDFFATVKTSNQNQSYVTAVTIQGHTFRTAAWFLGANPLEPKEYTFTLETLTSPQGVVTISYENDPTVTAMIERNDSADQIAHYVIQQCALVLQAKE